MPKWTVMVRGKTSEWGVTVSEEQAKAMIEDGFTAYEVMNTVPGIVADLGLTRVWCFLQDAWSWPSRWGR